MQPRSSDEKINRALQILGKIQQVIRLHSIRLIICEVATTTGILEWFGPVREDTSKVH